MAKSKKTARFVVGTLPEVAQFFNVPHDTVKTGWRPAGMPGKPGAYDLRAIVLWRESRRRDPAAAEHKPNSLAHRKLLADTHNAEEMARAKKLKNDLAENRLVDLAAAKLEVNKMFLRVKARLEAVPDEMEMGFPAETRSQNRARLANSIYLLLKEMASWSLEPAESK